MVLTPAVSALARSGATRSAYPYRVAAKAKLYALSNVARSGATRSNYHSGRAFVAVNGVLAYDALGSLVLNDNTSPSANTCDFAVLAPSVLTEGGAVLATIGSQHKVDPDFAGQLLSVDLDYAELTQNYRYLGHAIDYTWGLGKRKVRAQFTGQTVQTIAAALMAYTSGYVLTVEADVASTVVDSISFINQYVPACLTQLMQTVGGDWTCDSQKAVRLFFIDTSYTAPTQLGPTNGLLVLGSLKVKYDLSQVLTRIHSEGGGTPTLSDVVLGETIIPIVNASWYPVPSVIVDGNFTLTRGYVNSGPQEKIKYTAVVLGGQGGLVGPGATPTATVGLALLSGSGIDSGAHSYAASFVTASGESLVGPLASITTGPLSAPVSGIAVGTATIIASGVTPGTHQYAATFVTAAGETTASPVASGATGLTPAPTIAPTPGTPTAGAGPDDGNHDYAVTFVTIAGETLPSPISGQVTTRTVSASSTAPVIRNGSNHAFGASWNIGDLLYVVVTYLNAAGETVISPASNTVTAAQSFGSSPLDLDAASLPVSLDPSVTSKRIYLNKNGVWYLYGILPANFVVTDALQQSGYLGIGGSPPGTNTATVHTVSLTSIPIGGANVTSRILYRRSGGLGLKLLHTLADNTTTTYTDTTPNASLGVAPPATSTAYLASIPLTNLPLSGSSLVTSRKLYRTIAGGAQLQLLATIADNTTTSYTDTIADAALGANVPVVNTAAQNQVAVSGIPLGQAVTVTSRKLYRTVAGGSQLKLLATIADNTTLVYTDSTADAALGVNAPIADNSGLTQPTGQVLAGATSLLVAGLSGFRTTGGWALLGGSQVIRYTGYNAGGLTGIPSTGVGSLAAAVAYNTTVTQAPQLEGVPASGLGALTLPLKKGDQVNLVVQVDDVGAQNILAALIGGDGVQEDTVIDNRLSDVTAATVGEAQIDMRNTVLTTLTYSTFDYNSRRGRSIYALWGAPFNLNASYLIQSVAINAFESNKPVFAVTASSLRFTLDDLLRLVKQGVAKWQ